MSWSYSASTGFGCLLHVKKLTGIQQHLTKVRPSGTARVEDGRVRRREQLEVKSVARCITQDVGLGLELPVADRLAVCPLVGVKELIQAQHARGKAHVI